jgi:DNA polymerase I
VRAGFGSTSLVQSLLPLSKGPPLVAYGAKAELSCYRALGWPFPEHVIDLFFLHKREINGDPESRDSSLLAALKYHRLEHAKTAAQKKHLQWKAIDPDSSGEELEAPSYNPNHRAYAGQEKISLCDYCFDDVLATIALYEAMSAQVEDVNALHWGEFAKAQTLIEMEGLPIDRARYESLRRNRPALQKEAAEQLLANPRYRGIYVPSWDNYSWSQQGYLQFLNREGIPTPTTNSGGPNTDDKILKELASEHPVLEPIRQARKIISALRSLETDLDDDDSLRAYLSPFHTQTARNNPSSKVFIPAMPRAFQIVIRPPAGEALGFFDCGAEEPLIMGALSGDENMLRDYASGDPYIAFGIGVGILPEGATKKTHPELRNACKVFALSVSYQMTSDTLARRISAEVPSLAFGELSASRYITLHRQRYATYWDWVERYTETGIIDGIISTASGWTALVRPKKNLKYPGRPADINVRSIGNHPIQGTGSDILREIAILATRAGLRVCALVHDAIVVRCRIEEIPWADPTTASIMKQGARNVLADALATTDPALLPLLPDMRIGEDGKGTPWGYGTWTLFPDHVSVALKSPKTSGAALISHVREKYWEREGVL